jgi:hypothetical protein
VALHPAESFLDQSVGIQDAMNKELEADMFAQEHLIPESFNFKSQINEMLESEIRVRECAKQL